MFFLAVDYVKSPFSVLEMAHTLKCQHHENQLSKCLPIADKVESWLYNNCYSNDHGHHNLRSSTITTESPKQGNHDDDESSVDTTKYIKSNRTITRTKITSMTIKHYCYLSATLPSKLTPKIASQRNSRRSAVAQRFANTKSPNPNLVQPKRKQRRVRCKTATSGKSALAITAADSSSEDEVPMIENRFSRRIAKRKKLSLKLRDSSQRN